MPARTNPSTDPSQILVYRYRCPVSARNVPDAAATQMRLAHDLRNQLVAVEREHAEAVAAAWAQHPQVDEAQQKMNALELQVEELLERARKERVKDRARVPRTDTRDEIKVAKALLRTARGLLKQIRQDAYAVVKPAMTEAQAVRRTALADAGRAAKAEGLLWHTHDAVLAQHDNAVQAITAARKAGKPAELKFHRWDGSGRIRVTLMRSAYAHGCGGKKPPWPCEQKIPSECPERTEHHPLRSPALLRSGQGPWANVVRLPDHMDPAVCEESPPRHQGARETISLRVESEDGKPVWWDVPVFIHRPLPVGADVTYIEVIRERIAGNSRISVCVTVRCPAEPLRDHGSVVGIDLGWRSVEGGVRVGVIASTEKLTLPTQPEVAAVIRPLASGAVEVIVPDEWRDVLAHTAGIRSLRDLVLDGIRTTISDALNEGVEGIEATAADIARWRSPARFVRLARDWPNDHPLAKMLTAWRLQDKHLWEIEANERDQITARRRDTYRKVADWMCSPEVGLVAIEEMSLAPLVEKPDLDESDERQAVLARIQRTVAAPGELRSSIAIAAARRGIRVAAVDPSGTSRIHLVCGTEVQGDLAESIMVWCPTCEIAFDQDVNAARHLIARSLGDPTTPGGEQTSATTDSE